MQIRRTKIIATLGPATDSPEVLGELIEAGADVILIDTAGRLQIDEPLVQELVRLRDLVKPEEILLVLDSATGQEAVNDEEWYENHEVDGKEAS